MLVYFGYEDLVINEENNRRRNFASVMPASIDFSSLMSKGTNVDLDAMTQGGSADDLL